MSKPRLVENYLPAYQEQIRAELAKVPHPRTIAIEPAPHLPVKPVRVRTLRQQTGSGLNKLETAFLGHLEARKMGELLTQAITLKIANGCRYTPDFVEVRHGLGMRAYEVKGFMRDDAAVKIKVAAARFPWIEFFLATRPKRAGEWRIERVYGEGLAPRPLPQRVLGGHCESSSHHGE